MPTLKESIASLKKKAAKKERYLATLNQTLKNTQINIKKTNEGLAAIKAKIISYETRILTEALHKKGIEISEVAQAIEAGLFDSSAPEKPNGEQDAKPKDKPETKDEGGATYSTEDETAESGGLTDKEDTNDISDS